MGDKLRDFNRNLLTQIMEREATKRHFHINQKETYISCDFLTGQKKSSKSKISSSHLQGLQHMPLDTKRRSFREAPRSGEEHGDACVNDTGTLWNTWS